MLLIDHIAHTPLIDLIVVIARIVHILLDRIAVMHLTLPEATVATAPIRQEVIAPIHQEAQARVVFHLEAVAVSIM